MNFIQFYMFFNGPIKVYTCVYMLYRFKYRVYNNVIQRSTIWATCKLATDLEWLHCQCSSSLNIIQQIHLNQYQNSSQQATLLGAHDLNMSRNFNIIKQDT